MGISAFGASGIRSGVCTSTTRPSAPYEGMMIYETDTDKVLFWNGSAWRYTTTPQSTEPGVYTAYTPTWTSLTVGNGTNNFRYTQINKLVHFYGIFTLGSTSSVSGTLKISLPVTAKLSSYFTIQGCYFEDPGAGIYPGIAYFDSDPSTVAGLSTIATNGTYAKDGGTSSTVPFTFASGDRIGVDFLYEAA